MAMKTHSSTKSWQPNCCFHDRIKSCFHINYCNKIVVSLQRTSTVLKTMPYTEDTNGFCHKLWQLTRTIKNLHILYLEGKYTLLTGFDFTETLLLYCLPCNLHCFVYAGICLVIFDVDCRLDLFPTTTIEPYFSYLSRNLLPAFPGAQTTKFVHL